MFERYVCALGRDGAKVSGSLYRDPATLTKDQAQVVAATRRLNFIEVPDAARFDALDKLRGAAEEIWFAIDEELQGLAVAKWSPATKPFADVAMPHFQKSKELLEAVNETTALEPGKIAYRQACTGLATIINDLIALRGAVGLATVPPPALQHLS